jgi:PAS domain S-box-containing protein
MAIVLVVLVALTLATGYVLTRQKAATERLNRAITHQHESLELAEQLRRSSDDLTRMVRSYAVTGDPAFKKHFYTILDIREGRAPRPQRYHDIYWDFVITGGALPGALAGQRRSLQGLMKQAGFSTKELELLAEAQRRSDRLVELEETAMNAVEGRFRDADGQFSVVGAPDPELALEILFGEEYHRAKSAIMKPIDDVILRVDQRTSLALVAAQDEGKKLQSALVFLLSTLLVIVPLFLVLVSRYHRVLTTEVTRSEECFRSTFEQAAVGIAHVSTSGRFLRINDRFCDIVGYTREELLDRTFQDITHPEDLDADLEHVRELLRGEAETYSLEKRYFRKGDDTVWVNLTVSLVRDPAGDPRWFVAVVEDITRRKEAEARIQAYQKRLRALAAELTLAEEKERRRIAEELHDGTVQTLAWARMRLDTAIKGAGSSEAGEALHDVSAALRRTALLANQIASRLSSPCLNELGLAPAISEWMTKHEGRCFGIEMELVDQRDEEEFEDPDDVVRAVLFRSARELLVNAVQHSRATKVRVFLRRSGADLELAVLDNGIGCDLAEALKDSGRGLGLFAIRERMTDLGGELRVDSAPGKGFSAALVLPAAPQASTIESGRRESA